MMQNGPMHPTVRTAYDLGKRLCGHHTTSDLTLSSAWGRVGRWDGVGWGGRFMLRLMVWEVAVFLWKITGARYNGDGPSTPESNSHERGLSSLWQHLRQTPTVCTWNCCHSSDISRGQGENAWQAGITLGFRPVYTFKDRNGYMHIAILIFGNVLSCHVHFE